MGVPRYMRNRAKCKLCHDIIESFHQHDYVTCKCGEISVDGGNYNFTASAKDWKNFLRVDDDGNEIVITVKEKTDVTTILSCTPSIGIEDHPSEPTITPFDKKEMIQAIDFMIENIENLPTSAMTLPTNQYDHMTMLLMIKALIKLEG